MHLVVIAVVVGPVDGGGVFRNGGRDGRGLPRDAGRLHDAGHGQRVRTAYRPTGAGGGFRRVGFRLAGGVGRGGRVPSGGVLVRQDRLHQPPPVDLAAVPAAEVLVDIHAAPAPVHPGPLRAAVEHRADGAVRHGPDGTVQLVQPGAGRPGIGVRTTRGMAQQHPAHDPAVAVVVGDEEPVGPGVGGGAGRGAEPQAEPEHGDDQGRGGAERRPAAVDRRHRDAGHGAPPGCVTKRDGASLISDTVRVPPNSSDRGHVGRYPAKPLLSRPPGLYRSLRLVTALAVVPSSAHAPPARDVLEASPSLVYGAALLMRFGLTAHPGFKSRSLRFRAAPSVFTDGAALSLA
ncbi:protein of unknown function [Streptantibioticus cattleyicolor NRRL 8057 = DSM 46488]|nr:protein of unknown function [Streptantibioticus cattleyicolor NRRL 8057 = DSM 46488]